MRLNVLCFALGVWLLQQQAELPDLAGVGWLVALGAIALGVKPLGGGLALHHGAVKLFCFGLGFYWAAGFAHYRLSDALPESVEGRDIRLIGVVASLPQVDARSVRFEFDVERVLAEDMRVPQRIALAWWGNTARDAIPATLPAIRPAERWQLTVRLRRPRGMANPNGFDYEVWLLERGIRATGYVRPKGDNRRLLAVVHAPRYWVELARVTLRERIQRVLREAPYSGVITALAMGDQRAIPLEQWQIFTRTGVNHLMSISGLHVTMVAGMVFALAYFLWRKSARFTLWLPARKAAVAFGLLAAFGYTLIAGFAIPAQRTLYMLSAAAIALWSQRTVPVSAILAAALGAVLVLDPWAVLSPGFWLSFGAVALIMYVTIGRIARLHWLKSWVSVQWAVTLGLIPLLLILFQQVSIVSPFANAVAIPVVSLVVVPLALLGVVLPFDFLLHAAHFVMACCMLLLEWMSALPHAVWQQHAPAPWSVPLAMLGIAWLLLPRGFPARWLGGIALLPLFLVMPRPLADGEVKFTVLDVGQGLSIVARTRRHALLYDTGPAFGPGSDSGNRIIVPYLRAAGIRRLDGMIVSHDDIDHSGGAVSVLQALPVEWLLTSLPDMDPLPLEAEAAIRCYSGQSWEWDAVRFEVLGPLRESYADASLKDNDRSCVLKIDAVGGQILIPADIERRGERALLEKQGGALFADVLIAPHQGSKTSSSPEFVERVNPQVVIFPVGYRNRFGHPHREVIERYRVLGSRIYRTDRDGAVTLLLGQNGTIRIEPFRALYRRYWQAAFTGDPVPDPEEF